MAPNKSMILGFAWGARQRGLDYTRANAREIMLQKINMEETLTEITVYPDTIWWEREWDGEIKKKKERERENSTKEENIKHPSKYILQTFQCFSEPTIRGQTWESKPPLSPCSGPSKDLSMCLELLGAQQPRSKLALLPESLIIGVVTMANKSSHISSPEPCWLFLYMARRGSEGR